jgi:glycosyltransferase involved in cell wall biosynthesis
MTSDGLRAALSAAGRERAESFHWEQCAERSLEFFRRVSE